MKKMSRQEREQTAADNLRTHFNTMMKRHIGCVAINTHSTLAHELMKFKAAYQLKREGNIIATELVTKKGLRPDLVVLDVTPPLAYEIVHSETEESKNKKTLQYAPIRVKFIHTEEP